MLTSFTCVQAVILPPSLDLKTLTHAHAPLCGPFDGNTLLFLNTFQVEWDGKKLIHIDRGAEPVSHPHLSSAQLLDLYEKREKAHNELFSYTKNKKRSNPNFELKNELDRAILAKIKRNVTEPLHTLFDQEEQRGFPFFFDTEGEQFHLKSKNLARFLAGADWKQAEIEIYALDKLKKLSHEAQKEFWINVFTFQESTSVEDLFFPVLTRDLLPSPESKELCSHLNTNGSFKAAFEDAKTHVIAQSL